MADIYEYVVEGDEALWSDTPFSSIDPDHQSGSHPVDSEASSEYISSETSEDRAFIVSESDESDQMSEKTSNASGTDASACSPFTDELQSETSEVNLD
ncbi:uncharacterized protein N7446_007909 [Penicillium canescens]|uniref:Uncharacterized protein n=1 Tax=Penicillium canescens TaxID=5083 RepID=A0AAD6NF15_PENCN|nr:uncharacterized protein N7446_007909 [Penicillium canescens]KAJ6033800.1 hypothetical protein N7444_011571 [Penicillium canescens]KAJ6057010.1 hypothetical protein N7460_000284 [Penicillium canescens]KAJ6058326.1 hypothetical protein N7446_007909 [Penicillium canescens]